MSHTCSPLLQADDDHLSKHGVTYVESMGHLRLIKQVPKLGKLHTIYWCLLRTHNCHGNVRFNAYSRVLEYYLKFVDISFLVSLHYVLIYPFLWNNCMQINLLVFAANDP